MNHSRDKRQKTIPHPMPTPPPVCAHCTHPLLSVIFPSTHNYYIFALISVSYLFIVFDSSRLFDSTKNFKKNKYPPLLTIYWIGGYY